MQKFSSFGRKKKNRPKFDIEWICSKTFNCAAHNEQLYCGAESSLKVVLLFLVFFLFAFVIFSHSSSAKSSLAYMGSLL